MSEADTEPDDTELHRRAFAQQLFLQSLRETELLTSEQFDAFYQPQIARLMDHVWREVPFYRDRLAPFAAYGVLDIRSWNDIPILRYDQVASLGDRLLAEHLPRPADQVISLTPVEMAPFTRRSRMAETAAECERERFYELFGLSLSAPLAILGETPINAGGAWSITISKSRTLLGDIGAHSDEQLRWLADCGAKQLRLTAPAALALLEADAALSLDCIVVVAEVLPDGLRESLAKRFRARVCHLVERPVLGPIAAHDGQAAQYRVVAGSTIVEIVAQNGRSAAPGTVGELVVTPLYEYAAPLLRLATGIRAVAPKEPGTSIGVRWIGRIV